MESIIKFIKNKDYTLDIPVSSYKRKVNSIVNKTKSRKMAKHLSYDKKGKIIVKSIIKKKDSKKVKSKSKTKSKKV